MEWKTEVTELLGIKYPIVQGGLAYLAYADLAAAVSEAGALGQLTAMSLESPEALREEIRKVKMLTKNPFGVNIAIGQHGSGYEDMVEVALEEDVRVMSVTGGESCTFLQANRRFWLQNVSLGCVKKAGTES